MDKHPPIGFYIDDKWYYTSDQKTAIINPATEQEIAEVPLATKAQLDQALDAANQAFHDWRFLSAVERAKILHRAAEIIKQRVDEIAPVITMEEGKILAEARAEVLHGAELIEWSAEEGKRVYGQVIRPRLAGLHEFTFVEPVGPVALFCSWNYPFSVACHLIGDALAAGCTCIFKAPEETAGAGYALVKAFIDAGLPKGVLNSVFGVPAQVSEHLILSGKIRKVNFVGSTVVGKIIQRLSSENIIPCDLELGGHAPVIVYYDIDVDKAVEHLSRKKFANAGQMCVSPSRFYIHEKIHDEFVEKFKNKINQLKLGDGLDPDSTMGPVGNIRRITHTERLIADAKQRGAKIVTGGSRLNRKGYFFPMTLMTDVPDDAIVMHEEPFCPLIPVTRFTNTDEVIARANSTQFGLASYVFTNSMVHFFRVCESLEVGSVGVNFANIAGPETPFGGVKQSGLGYVGSSLGVEGNTKIKHITAANIERAKIPVQYGIDR